MIYSRVFYRWAHDKKIAREGLAAEQELPTRIRRFPQSRTCKCLSIHCGGKKSGVILLGSTELWVNQYTTDRPRSAGSGRIHLHVKCQRSAYNYAL